MGSRGLVVTALVSIAFLLAGCGSGSSGASHESGARGETAALTRSELVKQANAMCRQSQVLREKRYTLANEWLAEEGGHMTRSLREKIIRFMVVSPVESLSTELRGLASGDENGDAVKGYADILAGEATEARAKPLTVASGMAFADADARAQQLGLEDCSL